MRIISGKYKGRRFDGKIPSNVRPTQDALRETIFNIMLNHFDFDDKVFCDLCAGTGAVGIEALSRGAEFAYFIDISKGSLEYIKSNIDIFNVPIDSYRLIKCKAEVFFEKKSDDKLIDVIFADPPYSANIINKILFSVANSNFVPIESYIAIEYSKDTSLIIPGNLELITQRNFTIANFSLLKKNDNMN